MHAPPPLLADRFLDESRSPSASRTSMTHISQTLSSPQTSSTCTAQLSSPLIDSDRAPALVAALLSSAPPPPAAVKAFAEAENHPSADVTAPVAAPAAPAAALGNLVLELGRAGDADAGFECTLACSVRCVADVGGGGRGLGRGSFDAVPAAAKIGNGVGYKAMTT
jgi:hypothetical protein